MIPEVIVSHVFFVFPVVMGENKQWEDDDMFSLSVTEIRGLTAEMAKNLKFRYGRVGS